MSTTPAEKVRRLKQKTWRRRYSRHRAGFPVKATVLRDSGYVEIPGRCSDIGHGGLGTVFTSEVPAGEVIAIEFTLPPASEPLQVRTIVRYQKGFVHGMEFLGLTVEQQAAVDAFCEKREALD